MVGIDFSVAEYVCVLSLVVASVVSVFNLAASGFSVTLAVDTYVGVALIADRWGHVIARFFTVMVRGAA